MKCKLLLISIFFLSVVNAQHRINKLSISTFANFYSFGEAGGHLNNVVRFDIPFSIAFKTFDTVKRSGMVYELMFNNVIAYYKNILPNNNTLEVNDLFVNTNFIFPMLVFYNNKTKMEHFLGVGLSLGTLAGRDYYDESNKALDYNTTAFKELKFGKYWTSALLLDYQFDFKLDKRLGCTMGLRYATSTVFSSKKTDYTISQGTSFAFKYGLFYQFK